VRRACSAAAAVLAFGGVAAPPAGAAPPGFPDLSRFAAVDPAPYVTSAIKTRSSIGFVTAGLTCTWDLWPDAHTGVMCYGEIPGVPPEVPNSQCADKCVSISMGGGSGGASPLYVFSRGNGPSPLPEGFTPLAVGAKITAGNATCAATGDGVACIDPIVNHGFVLQHPLSWVF
jgi:hypothetical protein